MSDLVLEARNLGFSVAGRAVLRQVTLGVARGELLLVQGPPRSGKSALAHLLAGILEPTDGEVLVLGRRAASLGGGGDRPALVPQDLALVPVLTAEESVALPLQLARRSPDEVSSRANDMLDAFGLSGCAARLVSALSGGQQQRVALARAFAQAAPLIVLDEPTTDLDASNRRLAARVVAGALKQGAAIVAITRDREIAALARGHYELPA